MIACDVFVLIYLYFICNCSLENFKTTSNWTVRHLSDFFISLWNCFILFFFNDDNTFVKNAVLKYLKYLWNQNFQRISLQTLLGQKKLMMYIFSFFVPFPCLHSWRDERNSFVHNAFHYNFSFAFLVFLILW